MKAADMQLLSAGSNTVFFGAGTSSASGLPLVAGSQGIQRAILQKIGMSENEIELVEASKVPFEVIVAALKLGSELNPFLEIFRSSKPNLTYKLLALTLPRTSIQF
jgi:hypothetical protein